MKLLCIDDEPDILRALRRLLGPRHEVTCALSAADALNALNALEGGVDGYDWILCDVAMPEVSGVDLYDTLMKSRRELAERMVFMTAGPVRQEDDHRLAGLPNRVVKKPFTKAELMAVLQRPAS
jgi:CheY-like chemotaxis protein